MSPEDKKRENEMAILGFQALVIVGLMVAIFVKVVVLP
jgi:hypothetical protein